MKDEIKVQILELTVIMVTIAGLFLWERSESREDSRRLEDTMMTIHSEIHQEMKDFHGRLCALEERNKEK